MIFVLFLQEKKEEAPVGSYDSSEQNNQGRERSKSGGIVNAGQRSYSEGYTWLIRLDKMHVQNSK